MFRAIACKALPPFGEFHLDFPIVENRPENLAEVHLLTGVNGTGKTRLLAVLAAMLGNKEPLQKRLAGSSQPITIWATNTPERAIGLPFWNSMAASQQIMQWEQRGEMQAWSGSVPAFAYDGSAYVSDATIRLVAGIPKPDRNACLSFSHTEKLSENLLQAIANLKVRAGMDQMRPGKTGTRFIEIVQGLESTISNITGQRFYFNVTGYEQPNLLVGWGDSELPFNLLPDGLRSIIGWMVSATVMLDAWLQGMGNLKDTEAVFLLDEVENHLHPVWQRRILPAFQGMFPKAQMFVATHSPFVISSLNHGWIHILKQQKDGKVAVLDPVPASEGDSYISVLEEIMGLEEWYDPETEKLLEEFRAERKQAYEGDFAAKEKATKLAEQIGKRSMELQYMMGRELRQMERQLMNVQAK